jgi:AcrR family transcriptional regulator
MAKPSSQGNPNPPLDGHVAGAQGSKGRGAGERILTTATELFARFGYNGVSTRDVASAAQVNEVTVYRHFPHKHDLYLAVLESELQQLRWADRAHALL